MKRIVALFLAAALCIGFTGCAKEKGEKEVIGKKEKIIAVSILPQKNFVEEVCGDNFEVVTMIPPGASPETYEPTPAEMKSLEQASVYFSMGVPSEQNYILPNIKSGTDVVDLHKLVARSHQELDINGERDPHIWLSPKRVMAMVSIIAETLGGIDSEKAELYNENTLNYIEKLSQLEQEVSSMFAQKKNRDFIVFHPSFGYLADDYGLNMYALEEHGKEATAKGLAEMTDFAKQKRIKTIFYQAENSGKQALAFAEEIGGKAVSLNPLAENYITNFKSMAQAISDSLS